ncbi:CDP-glucose 4,6-dehydratase [Bacteriovoracaceae bacterium]|nr:CDP-glucose 4,6-dehydratase [Bacteriovoracaceae bacterium]
MNFSGKRVLITGHTGFKGSWLSYWMQHLGANTLGYSIDIPTSPSHFELLDLKKIETVFGDIRDFDKLKNVVSSFNPDIIFHLAAQPLVRASYDLPKMTFETNVIGTVNILEAARATKSVRAVVNVTTDKCYENKEWCWGYRENDPMGGHDPYSASKGCSELVTQSYRSSFFSNENFGKTHECLIASARAGNVIGGGDWAMDRLIPDMVKSAAESRETEIRNPQSLRPWQHVLEPLSGYILLGKNLLEGKTFAATSWNFGPNENSIIDVGEIAKSASELWSKVKINTDKKSLGPHEANLLKLDSSKAQSLLGWKPKWQIEETLQRTFHWYKAFYERSEILTKSDFDAFNA